MAIGTKTNRSNSRRTTSDIFKIFKEIIELTEKYGKEIRIFTAEQYYKLKLKFQGKSIAIIGPKAAGKTTFVDILRDPNKEIDTMNYTPTQGVETFKNTKINYKVPLTNNKSEDSIKFKLRKPKDVGGEVSYRNNGDWSDVCKEADYIFYIIDSFEYSSNNKMQERLIDDFKWISENNQLFAQNFGIVLFVNKIDRLGLKEEQDKWIDANLPKLEKDVRKSLNGFEKHLCLISPISLQSKSNRANSISSALLKVTERN